MAFRFPDDKLHLVLTPGNLADDYNKHASVTLVSACMNCSCPIVAHIFYEPFSETQLLSEEIEAINTNKAIYLSIYYGEVWW